MGKMSKVRFTFFSSSKSLWLYFSFLFAVAKLCVYLWKNVFDIKKVEKAAKKVVA